MANDLDYFKKQTSKNYADSEAAAIQAAKDANKANIQLITDDYTTQIADAKAAYDPLFRQNEIQRAVNERFLERKAAEMGLTDSGLSRTQQTANQLSYGNQNAEYMRQRQKAVDTLKAAMDAKILRENTDLNTNIAGIKTTYADKRTADAVSSYNKYIEESTKAAKTADEQFNDLYSRIYKEKHDTVETDPVTGAKSYKNIDHHLDWLYTYQRQNGIGMNSPQMQSLFGAAGISENDYKKYFDERYFKNATTEDVANYINMYGAIPRTETDAADKLYDEITKSYLGMSFSEIENLKNVANRIVELGNSGKRDSATLIELSGLIGLFNVSKNKLDETLKKNNATKFSELKNAVEIGGEHADEILNKIETSNLTLPEKMYLAEKFGLALGF